MMRFVEHCNWKKKWSLVESGPVCVQEIEVRKNESILKSMNKNEVATVMEEKILNSVLFLIRFVLRSFSFCSLAYEEILI